MQIVVLRSDVGTPGAGRIESLVTQHGTDVLVTGHDEANPCLGQPLLVGERAHGLGIENTHAPVPEHGEIQLLHFYNHARPPLTVGKSYYRYTTIVVP